jgi:hypothetical protein
MLRQLMVLILVFAHVLSVPGITIKAHYCNGKLTSVGFFDSQDPCHDSEEEMDCCKVKKPLKKSSNPLSCCVVSEKNNESCSIFSEKDCCSTEVIQQEGNHEAATVPFQNDFQNLELSYLNSNLNSIKLVSEQPSHGFPKNKKPPLALYHTSKNVCSKLSIWLI